MEEGSRNTALRRRAKHPTRDSSHITLVITHALTQTVEPAAITKIFVDQLLRKSLSVLPKGEYERVDDDCYLSGIPGRSRCLKNRNTTEQRSCSLPLCPCSSVATVFLLSTTSWPSFYWRHQTCSGTTDFSTHFAWRQATFSSLLIQQLQFSFTQLSVPNTAIHSPDLLLEEIREMIVSQIARDSSNSGKHRRTLNPENEIETLL